MKIQDLLTSKDGDIVYKNRYWIITPDNEVMFLSDKFGEPRNCVCFSDKEVGEAYLAEHYPDCRLSLIHAAYIPWENQNYYA